MSDWGSRASRAPSEAPPQTVPANIAASGNHIFRHEGVWIRPAAIEPIISDRCVWDSSELFVDQEGEYEDSDTNRAVLSFCYLDHINEDILSRYLPTLHGEAVERGLEHSPRLASPLGLASAFSDDPQQGLYDGEDALGELSVCAKAAVVTVALNIMNVDLAEINEASQAELRAGVQQTIAEHAGVDRSALSVLLSAGSVKVDCKISVPAGKSSSIQASVQGHDLSSKVLQIAKSIQGVAKVASGEMSVTTPMVTIEAEPDTSDCDHGAELQSAELSTVVGNSLQEFVEDYSLWTEVEDAAAMALERSATYTSEVEIKTRKASCDNSAGILQTPETDVPYTPAVSSHADSKAATARQTASQEIRRQSTSVRNTLPDVHAGLVWPHAIGLTPRAASPARSPILRNVDSIPDQQAPMLISPVDVQNNPSLMHVPPEVERRASKSSTRRSSLLPSTDPAATAAGMFSLYGNGSARIKCSGQGASTVPGVRPPRQRSTPRMRPPVSRSVSEHTGSKTKANPVRPAVKRTARERVPREADPSDSFVQIAEEPSEDFPTSSTRLTGHKSERKDERKELDRGTSSSPSVHGSWAPRYSMNEICPFSHEKMSSAVDLRCGHRFSMESLEQARAYAGLYDTSGQALICPLCGDQHRYCLDTPAVEQVPEDVPSATHTPVPGPVSSTIGAAKRCLSIYSSCTDAYLGALRKDWRQPLGLPHQMMPLFSTGKYKAVAATSFR